MFDMLAEALPMLRAGEFVAIATVTATQGSAPREPGASMLVRSDGTAAGSVSGGCVEGAVYTIAQEVLETGAARAERFGYSDDDAFAVGLTCGGVIDILIRRLGPADAEEVAAILRDVDRDAPIAVAMVVDHPDDEWIGRHLVVRPDGASGTLGSHFADHGVDSEVRGHLESGSSALLHFGADGERMANEMTIVVVTHSPRPRMVIFGAIDFAGAVADVAALLEFHVTICDARAVFATTRRFPSADEVVVEWPHRYLAAETTSNRIDRRTAVCVLTHDAKFDIPLLQGLLELPEERRPFYIGVMGSRRTQSDREARLREVGLGDRELALMSSPIGLDLRARTTAETAVSILAEVIATRWNGSAAPLSTTSGSIHG